MSQADVAKAMRIKVDAYKKYESRPKSMMPHQHIPAFIEAVGAGPDAYAFLYTGRLSELPSYRVADPGSPEKENYDAQ